MKKLINMMMLSKEDCPVCCLPIKDHETPPTIVTNGDESTWTCRVRAVINPAKRRMVGRLVNESI